MFRNLFILMQLVVGIAVKQHLNFGIDFFHYKNVSSVLKFSCGNTEEDIEIIKSCTKFNIYSAMYHPESSMPIEKFLKATHRTVGVWIDTQCTSKIMIANIMKIVRESYLFGKIHKWLVIGNNFNTTLKLLDEDAMSIISDIVIGVAMPNGSYDFFDIYNPDKRRDGKMNITKFGSWQIDGGLNVELTQDLFSRRWNLHGLYLRIASVAKYCNPNVTAYECLTNYEQLGQDLISKFGLALFLTIGEMFNFRLNITIVDEWCDVHENGTSFGMFPSLNTSEVDFGSTPASARWALRGYSRYVMPVWPNRFFFIFRDPTKTLKLTELLQPLSSQVWYGVMAVAGATTIMLMIVMWFEQGGSLYDQCEYGILVIIGVLGQQGLITVPNRISGRVILLSLMICISLTVNYYSAMIVSSRIHLPPDRMNDSLWSLGNIKSMDFATFPYRVITDVLKQSDNWEFKNFYKQIWSKIPKNKSILPIEVGLDKVNEGYFAYHAHPAVVYPYITNHFSEQALCELNEVHILKLHISALHERLNNPFTEITRVGLLKLWSSGVRMRNVLRWSPPKYVCSPVVRSTQPLTFYDVITAFIILFTGMIMSAFMFTFEIMQSKINELKTDRKKFNKSKRSQWFKKK